MKKHHFGDFTVPAGVYEAPGETFCGKPLRKDREIQVFIGKSPFTWNSPRVNYRAYKIYMPVSDKQIRENFTNTLALGNRVCAVLTYLQSREGAWLLQIPEGKEEVNLILGYLPEGEVLYLEHEEEEGKEEEYHLHIRPEGFWDEDDPVVVVFDV